MLHGVAVDSIPTTESSPSIEKLRGLESLFIRRSDKVLGRSCGVYVSSSKIILVRARTPSMLSVVILEAALGLTYAILVNYSYHLLLRFIPVYSILMALAFSFTNMILFFLVLYMPNRVILAKTDHIKTSTWEELEKRTAFYLPREDISEIEVKRPSGLRPGHLLIKMKSGVNTEIRILGINDSQGHRTTGLLDLMQSFCNIAPFVRSFELVVWSLSLKRY